jgi:hypothetical protein
MKDLVAIRYIVRHRCGWVGQEKLLVAFAVSLRYGGPDRVVGEAKRIAGAFAMTRLEASHSLADTSRNGLDHNRMRAPAGMLAPQRTGPRRVG